MKVSINLPDNWCFSTTLPVRVSDLNYGAHLGNDRVLTLAHEARVQFFAAHNLTELDIGGVGIIIADAMIAYRAQAFLGTPIQIQIGANDISKHSFALYYLMTHATEQFEIARVKTGIVTFDYAAQRIAPIPQKLLDILHHA